VIWGVVGWGSGMGGVFARLLLFNIWYSIWTLDTRRRLHYQSFYFYCIYIESWMGMQESTRKLRDVDQPLWIRILIIWVL
jgi:hypothetical protein